MEPRDKNRLDQWLDRTLERYGSAEPRIGLETRILANLAAEKVRLAAGRRRWWALGTATAMAAVGIAVWLGSSSNNRSHSPSDYTGNATAQRQQTSDRNRQSVVEQLSAKVKMQRRTRPPSTSRVELAESPKLSQFPSPRPPSEQEQLLARYVREFPEEAVMVARAQAERQRELERLIADEAAKIDSE